MITEYFEKVLENTHKHNPNPEEMWDRRAAQFSLSQQSEKTGFPEKITGLLTANGYLPGNTVLDIGGGTGRYALPFAETAESVTLTDLSAGMLKHAGLNAERATITNIVYKKLDWEKTEIAGSEYEKSHDIVFSSMCPAVRSKSGLLKMIAAAKKGCVLNQFVKTVDTLIDELKAAAGMTDSYDPHNDRESVQAVFNIVWELGYNVQLAYHSYRAETEYTAEEAISRYAGRFAGNSFSRDGKSLNFEEFIENISAGGKISVKNETVLATILWDV